MTKQVEVKQFVQSRNEIKSCDSYKHYPKSYLYVAPFTSIDYFCPHCNHKTVIEGRSIINGLFTS